MTPISITIESKPTTINFDGRELQVQKLSIPLPFGRKPTDISDIAACGVEAVYITEIREMDPEEFDGFKLNLGKSRDWLKGKGGDYWDGKLCVMVRAPGRPYLFIDPSGGDSVRYLARLG